MHRSDRELYAHKIKRIELFLDWLHQQALTDVPWEVQTELLEAKAVKYVELQSYKDLLNQLSTQTSA